MKSSTISSVGVTEVVKAMRTRLNKSQSEFGRLLRTSQNAVSRYEAGSTPGLGVLLRLYDLGLPSERQTLEGYIKKGLGAKGKYTNLSASVESLRGCIEDEAIEDLFLQNVPSGLREKWEPLIEIIARLVGTDRVVDDSIVEICRLWEVRYKDRQMETLLRDVLGYLRVSVGAATVSNPSAETAPAATALKD